MNSKFFNIPVVHIDCDQLQVSVYYSRKTWLNMWRLFPRLQFTAVWDTWWRTSQSFVKNFVSCINILNLNRIDSEGYDVEGFRAPLEQTGKEVTCDLEGSRGHRLTRCKHLIWRSKFFPDVRSVRTGRMPSGVRMWTGRTRQLWDGPDVSVRSGVTGSLPPLSSLNRKRTPVHFRLIVLVTGRRLKAGVINEEDQEALSWSPTAASGGGGSHQISLIPELLLNLWPEEAFWVSASHPVVQHRTLHSDLFASFDQLTWLKSALDITASLQPIRVQQLVNQSLPESEHAVMEESLQRRSLILVQWNKLQV